MKKIYHILFILSSLIFISLCSIRPQPVVIPEVKKVYNTKDWYSGYLDIKDPNMQDVLYHMHYFFFPTQDNYTNDPVLFWFNGGPGCSSLLGALYEHGPFLVNDAFGSLMNNKFAWNKKASVVYIQSPAEVGFSYMDNKPKGYTWTDQAVAVLNREAVLQFFRVWSQLKKQDVYIAGESYAGIYVPTLFQKLHDYNQQRAVAQQINIQGFAIGNGCTHESQCQFLSDYPPYLMRLYRDYGFITEQTFNKLQELCADKGQNLPDDCAALLDAVLNTTNGLNIYDAFRPCYQNNPSIQSSKISFKQLKRLALRKRTKENHQLSWAPPCVDSLGIDSLLLKAQNRKTLGIPDKVPAYSMCNNDDSFSYNRSITGSYEIYKKLIPLNKYRILIYSGDSDPAVPTSGTLFWINKIRSDLKLSTMQYWTPWHTTTDSGSQNSGSAWQLTKLFKLVTFKGIGHMAPQWNVEGGQKVIYNLIYGTQI